jgi:hypothetical protein
MRVLILEVSGAEMMIGRCILRKLQFKITLGLNPYLSASFAWIENCIPDFTLLYFLSALNSPLCHLQPCLRCPDFLELIEKT